MNYNFLSPNGFKFVIKRLPEVEFMVQGVTLPGLSSASIEQPSPFKNIVRHGDKLTYDDLVVNIRVDENMESYKEIYDWIVGLTKPETFTQYSALKTTEGLYSDATLIVLNSKGNPKTEISFKDIFPTSIGSLQFTTTSSSVEYISTDITFKHDGYTIGIV